MSILRYVSRFLPLPERLLMILRKGKISTQLGSDLFESGEIYHVNPPRPYTGGASKLKNFFRKHIVHPKFHFASHCAAWWPKATHLIGEDREPGILSDLMIVFLVA